MWKLLTLSHAFLSLTVAKLLTFNNSLNFSDPPCRNPSLKVTLAILAQRTQAGKQTARVRALSGEDIYSADTCSGTLDLPPGIIA